MRQLAIRLFATYIGEILGRLLQCRLPTRPRRRLYPILLTLTLRKRIQIAIRKFWALYQMRMVIDGRLLSKSVRMRIINLLPLAPLLLLMRIMICLLIQETLMIKSQLRASFQLKKIRILRVVLYIQQLALMMMTTTTTITITTILVKVHEGRRLL